MPEVEIVEVGPRDGLQNIPIAVPTATKVELIKRILAAGFRRLELGSFVSPKAIPQMADTEEVVKALGPLPGVRGMALVPNTKGAERALAVGVTELLFVISMSEAHNQSNVRRPIAASIEDLRVLLSEIDAERRLEIRVGLATSFHCPFSGLVDEAQVLRNVESILAIRDGLEFALSDTTGMALPAHVGSLARQCLAEFGRDARFGFHGHDTMGYGVANVLAGYEAGLRCFDGSVAGLGGCPFAPGATGNTATEDIVYVFARMGVDTGIDLDRLLDAAELAAGLPGAVTGGHVRSVPRDRLFRGSACPPAAAA